MKINFSQVLEDKALPDSAIFMIYGKPYHLIAEIRFKIKSCFLTKDIEIKSFYVDADFKIDELQSEVDTLSLFSKNKIILLNIMSPSIPRNVQDYITNSEIPKNYKIIISKSDTNSSFKKTKFYKMIIEKYCLIEIFPLNRDEILRWIKSKLTKSNITFTSKSLDILIQKNDGDTSSLSQEVYKMSLFEEDNLEKFLDKMDSAYKYTEFDLLDNILAMNHKKSMMILNYLKMSKIPEPYLLALLYGEIKKISAIQNNLKTQPYIPYNKMRSYNALSKKINADKITNMLKCCYNLDKTIKSSSNHDYVWNQFEHLIYNFE